MEHYAQHVEHSIPFNFLHFLNLFFLILSYWIKSK